eukprot:TRINITY_DN17969_c0_g1_i6.p4 TRINITY_DN17969_c0_g1~~TRINITY_DN17969_c0_g1_i6.p4  ORF type:complete len:101 (-),score=5.18 TRINITY_DN17969_c0_g1_i6:302-604(-)
MLNFSSCSPKLWTSIWSFCNTRVTPVVVNTIRTNLRAVLASCNFRKPFERPNSARHVQLKVLSMIHFGKLTGNKTIASAFFPKRNQVANSYVHHPYQHTV